MEREFTQNVYDKINESLLVMPSNRTVYRMKSLQSYKEIVSKAKEAETENNLEQAATLYEQALKTAPENKYAYERLMIIYRKLKRYKDELLVINAGLQSFKEHHDNKLKKIYAGNKKIVQLSNAFMKNMGLKNQKGKKVYYPEPIDKWIKRKNTVEKK
jgi:hypothetical protein